METVFTRYFLKSFPNISLVSLEDVILNFKAGASFEAGSGAGWGRKRREAAGSRAGPCRARRVSGAVPSRAGQRRAGHSGLGRARSGQVGWARGCGAARAGPPGGGSAGAAAEGRARAGGRPPFVRAARSPSAWGTGSGCCVARDRRLRALGERRELSPRTAGVHRAPPISRTPQALQSCPDSGRVFSAVAERSCCGELPAVWNCSLIPSEHPTNW